MNKYITVLGACLVFGLAGCDVDKQSDGELPDIDVSADAGQLPRYEIEKTREGRLPDVDVDVEAGRLPEYEIETADVEIGTKEVTVTVPDVDIEMPDDEQAE